MIGSGPGQGRIPKSNGTYSRHIPNAGAEGTPGGTGSGFSGAEFCA